MPDVEDATGQNDADVILEGDTYEIIRKRLQSHGKDLKDRLAQLNQKRKEIFGSIEPTLIATERITTKNNCIPRDMVPIAGNRFIFGYNVHMGLKPETNLSDVFAVYAYNSAEHNFSESPISILQSGRFEEDFKALYKYYKNTVFAKFAVIAPHLYMIFQVGKTVGDIKTFKWLMDDDGVTYVDNRSDHEFTFPAQHEFTWERTTRDQHRFGEHPHIAIEERLFVEAVGGDITFKVEDNTDEGHGIYDEPVDNPDQTLDDAEIHYAVLGHMIIVRIRPYLENNFRYFIFNEKIQQVCRVDDIENACVLLPDDQGLIFSNGYYLQTGELKQFDSHLSDMKFEKRIGSANGEDFLYVFYNPETGDHILLAYNIIEQRVDTPIVCNGFSYFDTGEMLYFRNQESASKHHTIQIWQTPFVGDDYSFSEKSDSFLYKIGNPAIVRCMAECNELYKLLNREEVYAQLYIDIVKQATGIGDTYFWIDKEEGFHIKEVVLEIQHAASGAIDEFEKVVRLKKNTAAEVKRVTERTNEILGHIAPEKIDSIDLFVKGLADLRNGLGEIISLKDLRYVDLAAVNSLEETVRQKTDQMSNMCVAFLLKPEALTPYSERVSHIKTKIDTLDRTSDAKKLQENADAASLELEMLIEIVSNLKIEDSTQTTHIIDSISNVFSVLNQVKATLKNKVKQLQSTEGVAQFNAQIKLLNQSVVNFLDLCDTPEKCDEYLTKIMIQIEELEGRFSDFDDYILQLSEKRDELYATFESRKVSLVEARNKRADTLMRSAERILGGVATRVATIDDINAINGYFASDLMIEKIRDIVKNLHELGDTVKADDIQSRLKTMREDTVRQLKDRKELYVDGAHVIQFGEHKFSVNQQPLDLTAVQRDDTQFFHLTGTNFFEAIIDPAFQETAPVWRMETPAENDAVYRGEFLAYQLLKNLETANEEDKATFEALLSEDALNQWTAYVRKFMGPRYTEGYTKGVHDHDGAKILKALVAIHHAVGLLRFHPRVRSLARVYWSLYADENKKAIITSKLNSFGLMCSLFPNQEKQDRYIHELIGLLTDFVKQAAIFPEEDVPNAGRYLFFELTRQDKPTEDHFVISQPAGELVLEFTNHLKTCRYLERFGNGREQVRKEPLAEYELIRDWITGFVDTKSEPTITDYIDEASTILFLSGQDPLHFSRVQQKRDEIPVAMTVDITEMVGDHRVIENGCYHLNYIAFIEKLNHFETVVLPLYQRYQQLKKECIAQKRKELRLAEFKPRILSSFVRNKLINQVYLPLIGDNLAKQIGVVGEDKRTDLMGLLLLVSPPGYGKTTLMEYLANRLGIIFMKINGPAIGHHVTSLDPGEAPNLSAREEILKLNLAFEMGDNVMIYLDDIQHCNPELLQKFISLCDAQRKIEGVYQGRSRTYDLRGKKVVVVMAGNPYTESGEKFKIPDMLANRADTYNLGDIIGDSADVFKMSYLENALTSNPVLNKLSSRSQKDVYAIIRIAETGDREGVEFSGTYSVEEVSEMVAVMQKMMVVRDTVLAVNQAYIYSAAQADEYRTEPAFKLQGSYRNMNRICEKIAPIMNESELKTLLMSHYENEAQTLTTGTEANLLKFKELTGWMNDTEKQRWEDIKRKYKKHQLFKDMDTSDPINRVVGQLSGFQDGLDGISGVLTAGVSKMIESQNEHLKWEMAEREQQPAETRMALTSETLADFRDMITQTIDGFTKTEKQTAPLLPEKVEVVSRIPKVFLKILEKQFELMHTWMAPTLDETRQQSDDMDKLSAEMKTLKTLLRSVVKRTSNFDEALMYFNEALKLNPKDAESYYNRSVIWHNRKDIKRALMDVKRAVKLRPGSKKYSLFAAYLQNEAGKKKRPKSA